jgi:hypothetical protein
MTFQAFPVYDFRSGINHALEPWKAPADAFQELDNFMLRKGVLRKRSGQSIYGQLGEFVSAETGFANPAGNQYTKTLASTTVIRRSVKVFDDGGPQAMYDDGAGAFTGDGTGTVNYDTGAVDVTFTGAIVGNVDVDYHYELAEDVRGIHQFDRYSGSNMLVGFQTKRMSKWNSTYEYFENVASTAGDYELWDSPDLMWKWAYNDKLWLTDNSTYVAGGAFPTNGIRYYDGSIIQDPIADDTTLNVDLAGTELIKAALIIFTFKERVIFLNTVEGAASVHYPQRAAWCWAGNPLNTDAWRRDTPGKGGFVDAPTNEEIVSFAFFGETPIVGFEHSVWALDYIGDPNLPFTWRRIAGFKDVSATFSGVEYVDFAAFLGGKGLIATNASSCDNFDKIIPDFVYGVDLENIGKCYSGRNDVLDQTWLAYPTAPSTAKNNSVLVYNYEDKAFSKYDSACLCFGNWVESADRTFQDYSGDTIDSLAGVKWGDRSMQAGYPMLLSGGENGYVYHVDDDEENVDVTAWNTDGALIDFEVQTGRLNPFVSNGMETIVNQVGFFVTKLTNAQFSVDFYVDEDLESVYTATVDCSTGEGDKMWVFTDVVASGEFIKMRIYLSDAQKADANIPLQQIEIHGIIFWMKPGAKIKQ